MKATFVIFFTIFAIASAAVTQQRTTQVDDESWTDERPASPPRTVRVTAVNRQRSPSKNRDSGAISPAGGNSGYENPSSAPAPPRQFIQSVATPLGLQCYLNNPNALQGLLAPPIGQPQLVAVYDQPAVAAPEVQVADQTVKAPPAGQAVKSGPADQGRKTRYYSPRQGLQYGPVVNVGVETPEAAPVVRPETVYAPVDGTYVGPESVVDPVGDNNRQGRQFISTRTQPRTRPTTTYEETYGTN